jgi:hypothetical protein
MVELLCADGEGHVGLVCTYVVYIPEAGDQLADTWKQKAVFIRYCVVYVSCC